MNEKRLLRGLQRREEAAFNALVLQHQGQIYNVCYRMLGNTAEAEDVAQDVFIKAFQAIASFRGDSAIGTWLYRIAVNLCKNRLKYLSRRHYHSSQVIDDVPERAFAGAGRTVGEPVSRPDEALEGSRAESRIQRALAAIDPAFRELLVLRDIQNLSYAEVVDITGLAEGTVKSRLHRARAALQRAYEAQEDGP
ncbi:MAG: sigma-70 family RNA polymerase sigma factor [bacterium]